MRVTLISSPNNKSVIEASINKVNHLTETLILDVYKRIGQASLSYAVRNRDWKDYTGNLQESMGFGIFKNGSLVFWETLDSKQYNWALGYQVENHDSPPYGVQAALQVLNNNTDVFSKGYKLLVVAGMNYAMDVENIHLHEVLTQAMSFTEDNWKSYFKQVA